MTIRQRLRSYLEFLVIRTLSATIPRMRRAAVLALARRWGNWAYTLARSLRAVGETNLRLALGDTLDDAGRERILRSAFTNFILAILDTFWFARDSARRIAEWVVMEETAFAPLMRPAAQICLTAHLGNWEVLGMAFSARGYPLTSVAAPFENSSVDELFNTQRRRSGQRVISKHGAIRQLLKTLRDGGKIAMLLDQNTRLTDGGIFVPFFGLPVAVSSAAAMLWRKTGAEVYFGLCLPEPDGRYRVTPPTRIDISQGPDHPDAVVAMTAAIARATEQAVRAHPGHWLWMYKRWKYIPEGEARERFPFYSKPAQPARPASPDTG